jgi:putative transposase
MALQKFERFKIFELRNLKLKSNQTMSVKSSKVSREKIEWLLEQPIDVQLSVAQQHLDICKLVINSVLDVGVKELCGERYSRDKPHEGRYDRWGYNPGSVKMGNQKLVIDVPRIYDNEADANAPLPIYEQLKELPDQNEEAVQAVLHGISTRDYKKVATQMVDSFGLSSSTISRQFIARSKEAVEEFCNRRFDDLEIVALFLDGKHLSGEQMIIALGVTIQGNKIPLAVIQSSTENSKAIEQMLGDLIERGLKYEYGLLCVIDGSKGLHKAIEKVFGNKAVIQRCQWHKRENVISYLNEEMKKSYRTKLQHAYRNQIYEEAKTALLDIADELRTINVQATRSLMEGLEETLTLQRLKLIQAFGPSFSTTNCIENLNSQLTKYTGRVKRWMDSEQRYRWVISGLIQIEKQMKKVKNCRQLHQLADVIAKEVKSKEPPKVN